MKRCSPREIADQITDKMRHDARKRVIADGFEPRDYLIEMTAVGLWLMAKLKSEGVSEEDAYKINISCGQRALRVGIHQAAAYTWNRWVSSQRKGE